VACVGQDHLAGVWNRVRRRWTRSWGDLVTANTFFLHVNVNDKRGGIRICVNDHEGSNGFALQLVLPIVFGRVYVVTDLAVRITGCDPMAEKTFVTLLLLTQGLDYDGDLLAQAGHEVAFAS